MSQTPIDIAFEAVRQDPSRQMEFFGAFLNAELFFPVVGVPIAESEETTELEGGDALSLFLLEVDGAPVLPVFDTVERLTEWADGNEMQYGSMPGNGIVEMAASHDPTVQVVLNVGQESFVQFSANDVEGLHEAWQAMHEEIRVEPGTSIKLGEPADEYPELKAALSDRMAELDEIEKAYVIIAEGLSEGGGYDICIVLDLKDQARGSEMAALLGPVASQHGPPGESVVIAGGHPHMLEYARSEIQPFYQQAAA